MGLNLLLSAPHPPTPRACPFPEKVSPRGAEGRGGSAAPPARALVGAALCVPFLQAAIFHTASSRALGAAGAGELSPSRKGLRLCADCTELSFILLYFIEAELGEVTGKEARGMQANYCFFFAFFFC